MRNWGVAPMRWLLSMEMEGKEGERQMVLVRSSWAVKIPIGVKSSRGEKWCPADVHSIAHYAWGARKNS